MPEIYLPILHAGQSALYAQRTRLNAVRCGRRWGKTKMMVTMAGSAAARGKLVGLFTPERKQLNEPYDALLQALAPIKRQASKTAGTVRTTTGGIIDFWALNDNPLAGRGREYDLVMGDEIAFTKKGQMLEIWQKSIRPTMITRPGSTAWMFSTPNGDDPDNFFFDICNNLSPDFQRPDRAWREFHAPTSDNPMVPPEELESERLGTPPLVFQQEYLAEFVDWTGVQFFDLQNLLEQGQPVPLPSRIDLVFAVIDSATKTGKEHDGTGVVFCGFTRHPEPRLVILDWDLVQIEGSLLEVWLPNVYRRMEELARACSARQGAVGALIEDKASGMILLQQAKRRGWPATPIDSKLTSVGKDERAISVSGYVYRNMVRLATPAYDKVVEFKKRSKNHLISQVIGFRMGDKDPTREDDLLDCVCYSIAVALGDKGGF